MVPMEQGAMTVPSSLKEPEAREEEKSSLGWKLTMAGPPLGPPEALILPSQ
jgi:hypothetical protein